MVTEALEVLCDGGGVGSGASTGQTWRELSIREYENKNDKVLMKFCSNLILFYPDMSKWVNVHVSEKNQF